MTRLEQFRKRIETDEGVVDVLLEYYDYIDCCGRNWMYDCMSCRLSALEDGGSNNYCRIDHEVGFVCPKINTRDGLLKYLKEDI